MEGSDDGDSDEEPATRTRAPLPGLGRRHVSTLPDPGSLIGRLEILAGRMRTSGVSSGKAFAELEEPSTPADPNPITTEANPDDGGGKHDPGDQNDEEASAVPKEVDPIFLAELESRPTEELAHAASKIQARYRGNTSRAMMASESFKRTRNRQSKLRNRKHGRDPPKFSKYVRVRRGHVHENSSRYGNANRHGVRALLGQKAATPERSSRHFHARHIHTHRPLTDTLPPIEGYQTKAGEDSTLHRGAPQSLPRVHGGGALGLQPPKPQCDDAAEEDLDSDEEEARRVAALGKGGLEPVHRFAGGKVPYGRREVECFARSISEDFTNYCKRGGLRRVHYKPAKLNNEWRACSALFRTQIGPWAGSLNGKDQWPGARKQVRPYITRCQFDTRLLFSRAFVGHVCQAARNLEQLHESAKARHEQITKGVYATRIPGLENVPSNHLMLGHAANPTGTKMRPRDKFRKRRSASAMQ